MSMYSLSHLLPVALLLHVFDMYLYVHTYHLKLMTTQLSTDA